MGWKPRALFPSNPTIHTVNDRVKQAIALQRKLSTALDSRPTTLGPQADDRKWQATGV